MKAEKIKAGAIFPEIELPLIGGGSAILGMPERGYDWKMVVVYRGRHCPLCTRYLNQLEQLKHEFNKLGVDIIAISADSQAQLENHLEELEVSYPIAYALNIEQMQALGLYISEPRSEQETDHIFAEPGLFVINEEGRVQVVDISNGPFVRPELEILVSGISFIRNPDNHYPIRGTY